MAMVPIPSSQPDFETVPAGSYLARCYRVLSLGTQEVPVHSTGEIKEQFKIILSFELPQALMTPTEQRPDPSPFTMHQRYTLSLHEKSNLRPLLESWLPDVDWRQAEHTGGIDLEALIDQSCYLSVVHRTDKKDKVWANVGSAMALPPGTECPPMVNEPKYFWMDDTGQYGDVFDGLSDSLKETIQRSPEYAMWAASRPAPRTGDELDDDLDRQMGGQSPPPATDDDVSFF